jgi:hypothetical protein
VRDHDHDGELARYGVCLTCADHGDTDAAAIPSPPDQLSFADADQDGAPYDRTRDHLRLSAQGQRVRDLIADGVWRTLSEISEATGDPEASVSARLRDLRKPKFGSHRIERRPRDPQQPGLWEYRWTTS